MSPSVQEFFTSIKRGDKSAVVTALDADPGLASTVDEYGTSALLTAAYYQQPTIADLLIERGASLNIFEACAAGSLVNLDAILKQDPSLLNAFAPDGFQPLGLASFFGHTAIVQILLAFGAEIDTPSNNGMSVTPLNSAAAGGHLEIACLLLEHGANPDSRQSDDFVPLHAAAQNGQRAMLELLIKFGADRSLKNGQGKTALDIALESDHAELADILK